MRGLAFALVALIALIQYPLWFGRGGWRNVQQLEQEVKAQQAENARLSARNAALEAEVYDLKHGSSAIEERARSELGMIKRGETFYQIVEAPPQGGVRQAKRLVSAPGGTHAAAP